MIRLIESSALPTILADLFDSAFFSDVETGLFYVLLAIWFVILVVLLVPEIVRSILTNLKLMRLERKNKNKKGKK
tara:strand:+ start:2130 stop:2354 length:225 start_codon:yes stop_codon:yes gene_type:complete